MCRHLGRVVRADTQQFCVHFFVGGAATVKVAHNLRWASGPARVPVHTGLAGPAATAAPAGAVATAVPVLESASAPVLSHD